MLQSQFYQRFTNISGELDLRKQPTRIAYFRCIEEELRALQKVYKDIFSCDLENEEGRLSDLPVGSVMVLEALPDIDDEVWPDAYIKRIEENLWVLTDVTRKYMEESDIPQLVYEQMSLEMNSSEDYEIEIPNTNYGIIIREDNDFKFVAGLWNKVRDDFFEYFSAIPGKRLGLV